jgi:voltage-gated potassium channel
MPRSRRTLWTRFLREQLNPVRQLQLALLVLLFVVALGTAGYVFLESWTWGEALFMTVITVTTVGFGEVRPLDASGRAFTLLLIILGVGSAAWALARAFEVALGPAFWSTVQRQRMRERLARMSGHYIVCGYGRLGSRIVQDLEARGEPYLVVEWSTEIEERLLREGIPTVRGDATRDDVLLAAGVERARGLVSALDSDAGNVLTVLTARGLNPRLLIVSRANTDSSESKLQRAGADRVVTPASIGGHRLAIALLRPGVHDFLNRIFSFHPDLEIDVGQVTIPPESPFAGQTVAGCALRRMRNVSILGIQRPDGEFILNPDAEHIIEPQEILILIGPAAAIYELEAMYGG